MTVTAFELNGNRKDEVTENFQLNNGDVLKCWDSEKAVVEIQERFGNYLAIYNVIEMVEIYNVYIEV